MEPEVSVCVIAYNHEKYIRVCLQSIVDQQVGFDFEIVVSDDCSQDATREIIAEFYQKYPDKIKPVFREENVGGSRNFINTHNRARGRFVCHCDGDDYFLPGKLQSQYAYMESHPDCSVTWHRMQLLENNATCFLGNPAEILPDGRIDISTLLRLGSIGAHSASMYRRSARRTTDENLILLDFYYSLEFLQSGYGYFIDQILGVYRRDSAGASVTASKKGIVRTKQLMASHIREFFKFNKQYRRDVFACAISNFVFDAVNFRISAFDFLALMIRSCCFIPVSELLDLLKKKSFLAKKS